ASIPELGEQPVGDFVVKRMASSPSVRTSSRTEMVQQLRDQIGTPSAQAQFKIIGIQSSGQQISTEVLVQFVGELDARPFQLDATWQVTWRLEDPPIITSLTQQSGARVTGNKRLLLDCTDDVMPSDEVSRKTFAPGLDRWSRELHNLLGTELVGYQGFGMGDVNGDELDDLYICQPGGLPNRLFIHQPDGRLALAECPPVALLDRSRSALIIDLNNDGHQDLAVVTDRFLVLFEGDGHAGFIRRSVKPISGAPFGLSAVDFDNDGDLDLYVCMYGALWGGFGDSDERFPVPFYDAQNGGANQLFVNRGEWVFDPVDPHSEGNSRWSFSAVWEDLDRDGFQDAYVANDFGRNHLYRHDHGQLFVDQATLFGVDDLGPGMSASLGDVNNDGRPDLYVSNMFSGAGQRVTRMAAFQPGSGSTTRARFQRMAKGNSLLVWQPKTDDPTTIDHFDDHSEAAGVRMGRWAWGSTIADLNNDGWQDLLVANGFLTQSNAGDL
ncbi:MAG: hypothetical protein ACI9TH_003043, partial [Kiritimatiellia bacterium]